MGQDSGQEGRHGVTGRAWCIWLEQSSFADGPAGSASYASAPLLGFALCATGFAAPHARVLLYLLPILAGDRHQLWEEKVGLVQPFAGNAATEWGTAAEPRALDTYQAVTGQRIASCMFQGGFAAVCTLAAPVLAFFSVNRQRWHTAGCMFQGWSVCARRGGQGVCIEELGPAGAGGRLAFPASCGAFHQHPLCNSTQLVQ